MMNMKLRLAFCKQDKMRFIGHLDLLKLFQRAIKRAKLPVAYSNGFNPHQLVGFALPLSLGVGGEREYAEIVFAQEISPSEVIAKLNAVFPVGITVLSARKMAEGEKSAASAVCAARYELDFGGLITADALTSETDKLLSKEEAFVSKTAKRVTKQVNIRADIFELSANGTKLSAYIAAGSGRNLKPELLAEYILKEPPKPGAVKITRLDLFSENGSLNSPPVEGCRVAAGWLQ